MDEEIGKIKIFEGMIPTRKQIPEMALLLMLIGILVPTAMYTIRLSSPTPAQLLVAISIALFASVLFLWIMDATGLLVFRAAWISKAIYGAAITSILGTSVAVYKDFFYDSKYPYEGAWQVELTDTNAPTSPLEFSFVIAYSESGQRYWGYSNLISRSADPKAVVWVEATDIAPEENSAELRLHFGDGTQRIYKWPVELQRRGRYLKSSTASSGFTLEMRRPA
jgi:hypothetical protein